MKGYDSTRMAGNKLQVMRQVWSLMAKGPGFDRLMDKVIYLLSFLFA